MQIKRLIIAIVSLWVIFIGTSQAAWTPPSWNYGDTIDAPPQEANQVGWATDPRWQMLGNSWGVADGVSWTVLDASNNPGTYGHDVINVGDTVRFKFVMHKTLWGTHRFDAIRAWIDWDGNGFDITADEIIRDTYEFNPNYAYSDDPYAWFWDGSKPVSLYYANEDKEFTTDVTFTEAGYFDLIARVICSRDLGAEDYPGAPTDWNRLTPWPNLGLGDWGQGEFEKYTVRVVPIPPALLLFGSGLMFTGFFRRRHKSNSTAV